MNTRSKGCDGGTFQQLADTPRRKVSKERKQLQTVRRRAISVSDITTITSSEFESHESGNVEGDKNITIIETEGNRSESTTMSVSRTESENSANTQRDAGGSNIETNLRESMRHFRDIHEVLPAFNPTERNANIELWLEKIEEYATLYAWDDIARKHYALARLEGVARKWRDSLPSQPRTWSEWKELLTEAFPCETSRVNDRLAAQEYRRKPGQDIVDYYYEKLSRCNRARMEDEETVEWIVTGLNNIRIRDYLGPLSKYGKPNKLLPDLKSANYILQEQVRSYSKDNKFCNNKKASTMFCFNCKGEGHSARQCTKPRSNVCFKCNETGHYAKDCKVKRSSAERTNQNNTSTTTAASTNNSNNVLHIDSNQNHIKYFKIAHINKHSVKSYVDLGSSCVTLRQDVADELGLTYLEGTYDNLVGYGSGCVTPVGMMTATLEIDGVSARTQIHVVPRDCQIVPLIVGHPYTEQEHIEIVSRPNELLIRKNENPLANASSKAMFWSEEAAVIPNNYLGYISAQTQIRDHDVCLEGGIREDGRLIPRCLVMADKEGKSIIPVLNISGAELKIDKGVALARGSPITTDGQNARKEVNAEPITTAEVNVCSEHAAKVVSVLNDFKDLVARNLRQVGCTTKAEMEITLMDTIPVHYQPYRVSQQERQQQREIINELVDANIIEESQSPFSSPVLLVRKKTGDVRLCIDYRAVNRKTVKQNYPMPRIDDQLDRLGEARYFSTLDLSSGYYQVPMSESSKHITAFSTTDGHYQFTRMPFGLCNAPAVFQRLVNTVLGNLRYTIAMAYLDDIIIPSKTIEEGLDRLIQVLRVLRTANLTLRLEKCYFLQEKIEYLGFEISASGIMPGNKKLVSIRDYPTPIDIRSVRSFIGLISYFRRFVKCFAMIARPLTDLLAKDTKFCWGKAQEEAFQKLKYQLCCSPILKVYDPKARTEVHTDACKIGIGGVLLQEGSDGKLHSISYFSRKTTKEEANYHSYELEALAVVCTLERFRVYLVGIHFTIKTDCNSMKLLMSKKDLNPRLGRWVVRLSEFNYTISYHKGIENSIADALSRNPVEDSKDVSIVGLPVLAINLNTDWIAAMQRADDEIMKVRIKLEEGDQKIHGKFTMYNARVYRTTKGRWRLYVPNDLRYEIVGETHKSLAHVGIDKTLAALKETYYFPGMREFVSRYINRCINCLYYKIPSGKQPGFLHPLDKGSEAFVVIHMDHVGPFIVTERGNKYIIAAMCGYSKYSVMKAVCDTSCAETLFFLREFISHYGKPKRIITDRGTAFTCKDFEDFCKSADIEHVKIATATPRANGQVERLNKFLLTCMSTICNIDCTDWDAHVPKVQWTVNNVEHSVTKRTPFEIIFGRKGVGVETNPLAREILELNEKLCLDDNRRPVEVLLQENQKRLKDRYDKKRKEPRVYKEGDLVMVRSETPSTGQSRKLEPKYKGPYEVEKVLDNDRYVIRDIEGEQQSGRSYKAIIAVDRLKPIG